MIQTSPGGRRGEGSLQHMSMEAMIARFDAWLEEEKRRHNQEIGILKLQRETHESEIARLDKEKELHQAKVRRVNEEESAEDRRHQDRIRELTQMKDTLDAWNRRHGNGLS